MYVVRITPEASAFVYNAAAGDFTIISELKFVFRPNTNVFELNQDPFGDAKFCPLANLNFTPDYKRMEFDVKGTLQPIRYQLTASQQSDRDLMRIINDVSVNGFLFGEGDADRINIRFDKGKLARINCHKRMEVQLVDALSITRENENLILVQQQPLSRKVITNLRVDNNKIICTTSDHVKVYTLNVHPRIIKWVAALLNT